MIDWSNEQIDLLQTFFPFATASALAVSAKNKRFVHYTSAETAFSILDGEAIWMRNALVMNDFLEIEHGTQCLSETIHRNSAGARLRRMLDAAHPNALDDVISRLDSWLPEFRSNTYMTCLSEHLEQEDYHGRLSMWRAYGGENGVALVINNRPFLATTDELNAYSHPVAYLSPQGVSDYVTLICDNVEQSRSIDVNAMDYEMLVSTLFDVFQRIILCTKHPGFAEELEWRVIYNPTAARSRAINEIRRTVRGVPQIVQTIPLKHAPEDGLFHADIPSLIERIIIGPTEDQRPIYQAFVSLLTEKGVEDAASKVWMSGIPLRSRT